MATLSTNNPLFEDKKEFLERQRVEYRKSLEGDVQVLKEKSQEVGKKLAIAGGALLLTFALIRTLGSGNNKPQLLLEGKKKKKKKLQVPAQYDDFEDLTANASSFSVDDSYNDINRSQSAKNAGLDEKHEASSAPSSIKTELFGMVKHQVTAYLIILAAQKLEEYLEKRKTHHSSEVADH